MTLETFLETFLAVIIGGGIVQIFTQKYFEKREKDNSLKYLALQLAFLFEGYAIQRADEVSNYDKAIEEEREPDKYFSNRVPTIPSFPFEEKHELLDTELVSDILDFPQRCTMANFLANYSFDVGNEGLFYIFIREESIRMGIQALSIEKWLRETYKLAPRSLTFGSFDIEEFLQLQLLEMEEKDRKAKERIAKFRAQRKRQ